jgi:hypothetical protein
MKQRRPLVIDIQAEPIASESISLSWVKRRLERRPKSMFKRVLYLSIIILTGNDLGQFIAYAQELGVTICACAPRIYEFTLDFALTCETNQILGDGVSSADCAIEPFQGDDATDLVPVSVSSIDVIELDQDLNILSQGSSFGPFLNGNTFNFTSVTNNYTAFNNTIGGVQSLVPNALQLSLLGQNGAGEC